MFRISKILSPPNSDDLQKSTEAKYAHYFSILLFCAYFYALVHELVIGSNAYTTVLIISSALTLTAYYLNKKQLLKRPLTFTGIILIFSVAAIMYIVDGSRDEATLAFPLVLIISSLAFDRRVLVFMLLIELVIIWTIGLLEIEGLLKGRFAWGTSYFQLTVQSIILSGSAFIIDLIVGDKLKIITELREKSDELVNANRELKKSSTTKDKFFSIIAHDLRSPFQGLLGIANILENLDEELTSEERKDFVTRLNVALKRQYDFLEELLLWGKFQRSVIDFEPQVCDIKEIVERNCEIFAGNLYKKKLRIEVNCPNEVRIKCDDHLISTVIRNLFSNAIKYTPAGGKITITVSEDITDVIMDVSDTGVGISEERKKQLFKIETNSSTRGTEDEAGTGLGLILCKEIMDKHNGEIQVESIEGHGSKFCIILPKNLN